LLHQVGDLFELNVNLRCQKINGSRTRAFMAVKVKYSKHGLCALHNTLQVPITDKTSQVTVLLDTNCLVKYTLTCQQINTFTEFLSSLHVCSRIYLLYHPVLPLLGIVIFHYVNPPFPLFLFFRCLLLSPCPFYPLFSFLLSPFVSL